jgi:hypothetical protein
MICDEFKQARICVPPVRVADHGVATIEEEDARCRRSFSRNCA